MKFTNTLAGLAAAAILCAANPANAAAIVFNFGGNGGLVGNPSTYSSTSGGLTVTASGYSGLSALFNQVNYSDPSSVTRTADGLGVSGNLSGEINDLGLLTSGEGLLLTFSQSVELTRAVLTSFGLGDSVSFEFGAPIAAGETLDSLSAPGGVWTGSYTGTQFFFAANTGLTASSFRVGSVTVNTATPAVPEPATWAMMVLGFMAMGSVLRRKSQQQQRVRYNFG
jgi:hypothetical protein